VRSTVLMPRLIGIAQILAILLRGFGDPFPRIELRYRVELIYTTWIYIHFSMSLPHNIVKTTFPADLGTFVGHVGLTNPVDITARFVLYRKPENKFTLLLIRYHRNACFPVLVKCSNGGNNEI